MLNRITKRIRVRRNRSSIVAVDVLLKKIFFDKMKAHRLIFPLLICSLFVNSISIAQNSKVVQTSNSNNGDEDKDFSNKLDKGKQRDQAAIDEAINGWWTASMKNHDQRIAWW